MFTNQRRITNFVWEFCTENGDIIQYQKTIRSVVVESHFKSLFSQPQGFNLMDQMKTIQNFPQFLENEDCLSIGRPMTMLEVKNTLNLFVKDKNLGPDG